METINEDKLKEIIKAFNDAGVLKDIVFPLIQVYSKL